MLAWQIWLIIAGVCLVVEIATVGFLVFWLAVAALITCVLSLFIDNVLIQTAIFVILSAVLIFLTRPLAKKLSSKDTLVTNANSIVGKEAIVIKEINEETSNIGQVKVSGDIWSAICNSSTEPIPVGSKVKITKIDGVKLVVEPLELKSEVLFK